MANASLLSPESPHFFQPLLSGFQSHLKIPVKFFSKHIEEKYEEKTVNLRTDASEKVWKVKREGQRLTDGWKEFVEAHDLQIGDFVVFRHEGNMLLHVTALGPSCCEIQYTRRHSQNDGEEESDETGESSRKENVKTESDQSSSELTCFSQFVTAANLKRACVTVPMDFARRNGFNKGRHEIVLMNEEGNSWDSSVKRKMSNQVVLCKNWRRFCTASKLEVGEFITFRLLRHQEKPVFQLCSRAKAERKKNIVSEEADIVNKTGEARFVKLTPTPNSLEFGKQNIPIHFTRVNKLNKPMKIILVDRDKLEWSMKLNVDNSSGTMYIMGRNGWKSFCAANEVSAGESLTLELILGGKKPLFKFCSKIVEQEAETRAHKRARTRRWSQEIHQEHDVRENIATEGEPSRRTRSSNKSTRDQENFRNTQFRLVSDVVAKVKQSVVDTLTCIRRFQAELKLKEQNLEASLQEINNLEEKIMGIKDLAK